MAVAPGVHRAAAEPGRPEEVLPAPAASRAARRRWHVCFVAPYAWPVFSGDPHTPVVGGAEVQQATLARLFASHGYRVSMVCQDFGQPDRVQLDGVTVHKVFGLSDGVPVFRFLHPRLTTMWRALREVDADIYYYRSVSMWVGVLAEFCRRYRKRLVYAGASDRDFEPRIGGQIRFARDRWLYRRGVARAHALIAQNRAQIESARCHYGRVPVHIPSCYRPPPARATAERDLVLWVATVHPYKRPELFLELARRLPGRRFALIGGPSLDRAYFERIGAEAKRLPNVRFTGFLPLMEVEKWFDRARLVVNTSLYEGMPNTFLQAWARGVPSVATVDVGTTANRAVAGIDELAAEVECLLADAAAWREASAHCREYFESAHSCDEVMARYACVFDQVMAQ
jgi:glycosyltransferase involved in cell wall biosynthesis